MSESATGALHALRAILTPLLGSTNRNRSLTNSASSVDRALGAAATLSVSLVILRLVAQALRAHRDGCDDGSGGKGPGSGKKPLLPPFLYPFVQIVLKGLFVGGEAVNDDEESEEDSGLMVLHPGSCHCGSVHFELRAPRVISALESSPQDNSKIRYPHTRTVAHNFHLTTGTEHMHIYYILLPASMPRANNSEFDTSESAVTAAHAFCDRCGVHILRAPDSKSDKLEVNVACLDDVESRERMKILKVKGEGISLGAGVPMTEQWEDGNAEDGGGDNDERAGLDNWGKRFVRGDGSNSVGGAWGAFHSIDAGAPVLGGSTPSQIPKGTATASIQHDPGKPGTPTTFATTSETSFVSSLLSGTRYQSDQESHASVDGSDAQSSASGGTPSLTAAVSATESALIGQPVGVPTLRKKQTFTNVLWHVIGAVVVMLSVLSFGKFLDLPHFFSAIPIIDIFWDVGTVGPDTVYVPGAGFSAFWFTLGRLQSIEDPASKDYYCFSAGCLSVVARLSGQSLEDVLGLALDARTRWKKGNLSRFDVVGDFVDGLLASEAKGNETLVFDGALVSGESKNGAEPLVDTTTLLSKLHVVTTAKTPKGLKHVIRNPTNTEELREMLVQTTWIPFATGGWFWTRDSQSGDRHLDGAFSVLSHPKCSHHLGLPLMLDLFLNSLNINLSIEKVEQYWKAGLAHGL